MTALVTTGPLPQAFDRGAGLPGAAQAMRAQTRAPLLEAVRRASRSALTRPHCPGHQGGRFASDDLVSLLGAAALSADVWLETGAYDRVRREAEDLAAQAWGARRAWLLGNGSTSGNLAWMLATLRDGEPVLVGRDAHASVMAGLVLSGARPVWLAPRIHPEHGLPLGVEARDVAAALARHPGVRQVVVTSPGYSSACADLPAVVSAARAGGARVYVDQAWGPHLAFHPELPDDALASGADGMVVSVHKTATALSSGSVLLAGESADDDTVGRLCVAVRMTQTTSPLLPLLASVDAARRDLAAGGAAGLDVALSAGADLRRRLSRVEGLRALRAQDLGLVASRVDPLKVVVDVSGLGASGWQVEATLRGRGVPVEGADAHRVYLMLPATGWQDPAGLQVATDAIVFAMAQVARALTASRGRGRSGMAGRSPRRVAEATALAAALEPGEQVLTPREAHARQARVVPLSRAAGEVAAEPAVPYPPGIPVLLPGERVSDEAVAVLEAVLAAGGHVHGCADPALSSLRVLA